MPRRLQGKRVLLVEDEALIALDAEDALLSAGCHLAGPAHRLQDAVRMARDEDFDAAVLDVNLAGDMVWPVAEVLRTRDIPFLLLTGFGRGLELPQTCRQAPVLSKPVKPDELTTTLKTLLARSTASRTAFPDRSTAAPGQS
jgi:DNA-binding response OmpR family regulator